MVSSNDREAGFSLIELSLAIAIGLSILAGSFWMIRQHNAEARVQQSKLMLETVRTQLSAYRYRYGSYPSFTELQRNWATTSPRFQIVPGASPSSAVSDSNRGSFPEPVSGVMRVFDRRLAPGQGGTRATGPEATGSLWGGWFYDADNGSVSVNLNAAQFPGDNPSLW